MYTSYLNLFQTHTDYEMYLSANNTIPNVIYCTDENHMHYLRNDNNPNKPSVLTKNYLTTVARENGTISFNICNDMGTEYITSISYSTDNGETWITTNNTNNKSEHLVITVNVSKGDKVMWKGNATQTAYYDNDDISFFSSTCEFDVKGNIMSLLYEDNFDKQTTIIPKGCFYYLFGDFTGNSPKIVNASMLILPATTLAENCYYSMFEGCTSLINAPKLPATTLAKNCYSGMFRRCTSLVTAPELHATTLAELCCYEMFKGCTSLINAPKLPATTLAVNCYYGMFSNCTSLINAPKLPATELTRGCYQYMFQNCTSLTTAPILPAITLIQYCYLYMFNGCTNLNYINAMFTTTPSRTYTQYWVEDVAATGTFIKNPAATWNVTGLHSVPVGWQINNFVPENYLTFNILSDGIINWKANNSSTTVKTISYSINDGEWISITSSTAGTSFNVSTGDKVRFKGNNNAYATSTSNHNTFNGSTASFNLEGNIMSLVDEVMFDYNTTLTYEYTFVYLFSNINVIKANNLILPATTLARYCYYNMFLASTSLETPPELPATTLANYCYSGMFYNCKSLTRAPELSATTLANLCYYEMFQGCTNLTSAPELPATTLANNCYSNMFYNCKNLATAPELPATTLADSCYTSMFQGCTSLTRAPELPATTLTDYCYYGMFQGCTSLTKVPELPVTILTKSCYCYMFYNCKSLTVAPELPATILTNRCYQYMFNNCINLDSITCLATDISSECCTDHWVDGVATTGTFIKADKMNNWTIGSDGIPPRWNVIDYYTNEYFTTVACENGTISFNIWNSMGTEYITSISYSTNNGNTWNTTNNTNNKSENLVIDVNVNKGDKVIWKCDAVQYAYYNSMSEDYESSFFSSTCKFDVQGNIMSLLYGDNFNNKITLEDSYTFCKLFSDYKHQKTCKIVNANNLILPATSLADGCYQYMFLNCTYLETAPELPATILSDYCYWGMFNGCTSLETAPKLPATTLTEYCYSSMFEGCTSLVTAPELPATTLAYGCYAYMFKGCISLTAAYDLPATTLATQCYEYMFEGCISLITAPKLPAITLVTACYCNMFNDCTSLNSITCLATDISANLCTTNWVDNVATTGTFTKHPSMNNWPTGDRGIPTGWTINDYADPDPQTIWVDDFLFINELNDFIDDPEGMGANGYYLTNNTIQYNGNTYYVWNSLNDTSTDYGTLLTKTDDFDTLYDESLEENVLNTFNSFVSRANSDQSTMYGGEDENMFLIKIYSDSDDDIIIWVDDFIDLNIIHNPDKYGSNKYINNGETFIYNGNRYYLWEMLDNSIWNNSWNGTVAYLLTSTNNFSTLQSQSIENNIENTFDSLICFLGEDNEVYNKSDFNDQRLIRVTKGLCYNLKIWVDDYPEYRLHLNGESVEDAMQSALNNSNGNPPYILPYNGANPYIFTGDTISYNGNIYYLWEMDKNFNNWWSDVKYLATTTIDFDELNSQSLYDDLNNHFTSCIGQFSEDKHIYNQQHININNEDGLYLLKVEKI